MAHNPHISVAIVHDSLIEFGGAERLVQALCGLYPTADLYTSVGDGQFERAIFPGTVVHHVPIPQRFFSRHPSLFQSLSPFLWGLLDFERYDVVIANSSHLMANLVRVRKPVLIQYVQSLPKNIFGLEPATPLQRMMPYAGRIRRAFSDSLRSCPYILTSSRHMQRTLRAACGVQAGLMYPPVSIPSKPVKKKAGAYYLIVTRLDRSKAIELAIHACNILREALVIVGVSNEPAYDRHLRQIAGPSVAFAGFQTDREIQYHYQQAKAFLFTPKNEDFGIAPVEAMGAGVPVIAFKGGGARETVTEGKTGIFFRHHTVESLVQAMRRFDGMHFDTEQMRRYVEKYSVDQFGKRMRRYVDGALLSAQG